MEIDICTVHKESLQPNIYNTLYVGIDIAINYSLAIGVWSEISMYLGVMWST